MENTKQGAIQILQDEVTTLEQEISVIKRVIQRISGSQNSNESRLSTVPSMNVSPVFTQPSSNGQAQASHNGKKVDDFPQTTDQRIVYILQVHLRRAARLSEIQQAYETLTGKSRVVRADIIKLRKKGLIASIKFNNNWNLQYNGLSEWVEQTPMGPRFVEDHFKIDPKRFPYGLEKSELVEESDKEEQQKGHTESVA